MVTLFFENNFTEPLILTNAGLHFDWMPKDGFYGFNLKENPITVQAGGSYVFQNQIRVKVPNETSLGAHSYYAGVDGVYGSSQAPFSVDSVEAELEVISSGIQTPAPTNPGSGNQGNGQGSDLLLYGAIAAVIIVVILLLVIVIMRKKKTTHVKSTEQPIEETDQAKPEQKPSGQDFSI
jgi:hypothetical protein